MSRQTLVGVVALGVTTGAVLFACKSNNIADTTNNITNNTYITKEVGAAGPTSPVREAPRWTSRRGP